MKRITNVLQSLQRGDSGSALTPPEVVSRQIEILVSAYRRDDYADAESFVLQLGMVLAEYPPEVVVSVTEPRTGIQRRCKFPPSIAEVVEACEDAMAPIRRAEQLRESDRRIAEQIERRKMTDAERAAAPDRRQLEDKLGRALGARPSASGLMPIGAVDPDKFRSTGLLEQTPLVRRALAEGYATNDVDNKRSLG